MSAPAIAVVAALATLAAGARAAPAAAPVERGAVYDVRAFGARGDGAADDSAAFRAALDAARAAGGGVVYAPAGTYVLAPPPSKEPRRPRLESITLGSNVWLRGDGPATVLRVKAGVGSYRALFSTGASAVENVVVSDLRVDQNCGASGGDVRPLPGDPNHFLVLLVGAARNVTVERVRFDPVCGVNTVSLNSPAARNLVVRDCYFRFVKGPTTEPSGFYDNTAVYLHGRGLSARGNVFESTPADGARGAIELHAAEGLASENLTRGYRSCVRVVGTSEAGEVPPRWNGFTVMGNTCLGADDAINVWSITGHHVRGVAITGNTIELAGLDHAARDRSVRHSSGISFISVPGSPVLDGDIADVVIAGNAISAQPSAGARDDRGPGAGGIVLTSRGNITNVVVRGNVLRDIPSTGIHLQSTGRGTRAKAVRIEGNSLVDPGSDPAAGVRRAGILLAGVLEDVEVAHNAITATTVPCRGRFSVAVAARPGSARVGVHDNAWSGADPAACGASRFEGPVDAGIDGRTRSAVVSRRDQIVALEPASARIWDVTAQGADRFTVQAPRDAAPGQRLTIRIRNARSAPLEAVRWDGFNLGRWTSPAPGHHRVVEVLWDGFSWTEVSQSSDVPN